MPSDDDDDQPTDIRVDSIADAFEAAWKSGTPPDLRVIVAQLPQRGRLQVVEELIGLDRYYRDKMRCPVTREKYEQWLPDDDEAIFRAFEGTQSRKSFGDTDRPDMDATIAQSTQTRPEGPVLGSSESKSLVRYFGDYELIDEIARGGMGVVYRARQISLDRTVAVKMILGADFASEEAKQRFQMEAESAARLDHPHIVPIYDIGEHDGLPYFSMKFIDGRTLSSSAGELHRDSDQVIQLVIKIANAVHHAHQRGIVHRDLKPGNVLLDSTGEPLLTDFGLARRSNESELTQTGAILGTPEYMPPEQARGESATTASDIYSLGAILYRLLTGRTPHTGESTLAIIQSIGSGEITKPRMLVPNLHRDLEAIVLKCLASDPNERYTSAADLAQDLRAFREGTALIARPAGPIELIRIWVRQHFGNIRWVPAIAMVVGGVSGFLVWWLGVRANMNTELALVEQIRPSDRAPLWWLDLPIPPVLAILIPLGLLCSLGMLVKLIIQPKSRTADAIAGFGVGLLTGIVFYISGGGALLIAAASGSSAELDAKLLILGNQNPAYAEQLTVARYPELLGIPRSQQIRVLESRIASHIRTIPLLVGWIGAPLAALTFAIAGMFQTVVFGDIIRRHLARRKLDQVAHEAPGPSGRFHIRHYLNGGFFEYTFFAMLLGQCIFVGTALGSQLLLVGATSIIDWTREAIAILLAVTGLIAVATHWPAWVRIPMLVIGCIAGQSLSWRIEHDVSHRWDLVSKRGRVARYAREAAIYDDPLTKLRFAEAQRQLGFALMPAHTDRALPLFRSSVEIAESIDPKAEVIDIKRQTLGDSRFGLAVALLLSERIDEAADALIPLRDHSEKLVGGKEIGFVLLVGNVLRSASVSIPDEGGNRTDWTRDTANRLAQQIWSDPKQASLFAAWFTSRQTWHLYGPIEAPMGSPRTPETVSTLLASTPPIEQTLVAMRPGDAFPKAKSVVESAADEPVLMSGYFQRQHYVAAYAISEINSAADQTVTFRVGSDDGVVAWVDGVEVHRHDINRALRQSEDRFDLDLSAGPHIIVLKVSQGDGGWGFVIDAFRTADPEHSREGQPVVLWSGEDG